VSTIPTPFSLQALAVKALVGLAVVGGAFGGGYYLGFKHEKLVYDNFVLSQKDAAQKQLIANKDALDKQASANADQVRQIQSEYADNAQHLQAARDAALADSTASAQRLRQYLASSHARATMPGASAGSVGTASQAADRLSDGVSSLNFYLVQRFHDADDNTAALNEAIDLLAADRQVCTGALPGVTK
jgi:uncharacterized membrane-anchored protein YhcB (DUF1043 family)